MTVCWHSFGCSFCVFVVSHSDSLPIEDPFLRSERPLSVGWCVGIAAAVQVVVGGQSFLHTANPLLAAITFLASAVDGNVAAAASRAALASLTDASVCRIS